jgi:hypothetical protein
MKSIAITVLLLATLVSSAFAQTPKCDCTIVPFKPSPPCFDYCCSKVLKNSTFEELQLILGVKEETARRIVEWKGRKDAKTLGDFKEIMSQDEIKKLSKKIQSLNRTQLTYFSKSPSERTLITVGMSELLKGRTTRANQ